MSFHERLATVLEKTADYLDRHETEKTAAVQEERRQAVTAFNEKFAAATGEHLPEDTVERLVSSDENILQAFQKLAARVAPDGDDIDTMGTPDERSDGTPVYMTKKAETEAKARAANDRFLDFIME